MSDSMIRDISLSDNGEQRIRWVAKFMPAECTSGRIYQRSDL